jgi:hypothetical protein
MSANGKEEDGYKSDDDEKDAGDTIYHTVHEDPTPVIIEKMNNTASIQSLPPRMTSSFLSFCPFLFECIKLRESMGDCWGQ